jgi:hypothetical protein
MMAETEPFNLEQYKFLDEAHWLFRWYLMGMIKLLVFMGVTPVLIPVTFKKKWYKSPTFKDLGKAIGLDETSLNLLAYHQRRVWMRAVLIFIVYFFIVSLLITLFIFLVGYAIEYLASAGWGKNPFEYIERIKEFLFGYMIVYFKSTRWEGYFLNLVEFISYLLTVIVILAMYLAFLMLSVICLRVTAILTDKYFADTLCVLTVLYLVIELSRDDTLTRPGRRKEILHRINFLARNTLLMPLRYASKSRDNQNWVHKHFKNMELYIRERERWAIAPKETTLSKLRADFYKLVPVYLTGSYGDFDWMEERAPKEVVLTRRQRFVAAFPRMMGFLLPILIMGYFLWRPAQAEAMGLKGSVIAIILISWVLLTIDTVLRLGVVASLVNLAKGIKDLK